MKFNGLFAIENEKTGELIQSEHTRGLALKGVQTLNDQERRNGRSECFRIVEITEEELKILRRARD